MIYVSVELCSIYADFNALSVLTLLAGHQEEHLTYKN